MSARFGETLARMIEEAIRGLRLPTNGITITVALAPLTPGGTAGSLEITNGVVTAYVAPT